MGLYANALMRILKVMSWNGVENKTLCMMGKQSIMIELPALKSMVEMLGMKYDEKIYCQMLNSGRADSYQFFKMIGLKEVHALDYSSYEGADLIYDLNVDVPEKITSKFDYVIDGGVTEHVYNVAKTMENMSKLLTLHGIIFHILPAEGLIDHGFYSFSPTFFLDYYEKNEFCVLDLDMEFMMQSCKENKNRYGYKSITSVDCRLFDDTVEDWEKHDINEYVGIVQGLEEVQYAYIWCIARKIKGSPIVAPIQGTYQKIYPELFMLTFPIMSQAA